VRERRYDFPEHLQALSHQLLRHLGEAGDVAAGTRESVDERPRRRRDDDRDRGGRARGFPPIGAGRRHQHIDLEPDQLGGQLGQASIVAVRVAVLDRDVLTLDPPELAQTFAERLVPPCRHGRREWRENSDPRHRLSGTSPRQGEGHQRRDYKSTPGHHR
jgi:hypothetical protein